MDARLRINAIRNEKNRYQFRKGVNNNNGLRNAREVVTDLRQLISNSNQNKSKQTVGIVTKSKRNGSVVSKSKSVAKQSNRNNTRVAISSSDNRIPKVMVKLSALKSNDRSVSIGLTSNKFNARKSNLIAKQLKSCATNSSETLVSNMISAEQSNASHITQSTADIFATVANEDCVGHCEVLISNLNPSITEQDIVVLFGEIGQLVSASKINKNVALVVYRNSSDAVNACQTYHNRLLDGMPMQCNILSGKQNPYVIARKQPMPFGIANARALFDAQVHLINATCSQPRKMTAAEAFTDPRRSVRDDVNFTIKI